MVDRVKSYGLGCYIKAVCVGLSVFMYADDILLLAPSPSFLSAAALVYMCEDELHWLDLTIKMPESLHVSVLALVFPRELC